MNKLNQAAAAAWRAAAWLLPAGRRDWAEAVWAEAHEVVLAWILLFGGPAAAAALFVTALGTSTVALLLESGGLRHWLSYGQLTAIATYRTEIYAGANVFGYLLIWISFPVIGLIASATVVSVFADSAPPEPSSAAVPGLPM
jgi:hypothetical protein